MGNASHRRVRTLVRRYLDPQRDWSGAEDGELRSHLRDCEPCRAHYRKATVAHRLMVGAPLDAPSGFERQRMGAAAVDAALGGAAAPKRSWAASWGGAFAAACAAAAVALVVVQPWAGPEVDPTIKARGGEETVRPVAGIGISGVTDGGDEYEVVASDAAPQGDYLRFYYSNEDAALTHLFVVGVQTEVETPIWYAPMPPEETESLAIGTGRQVKLPFENKVSARHAVGPLKIVAIFSQRPLTTDEVGSALDPATHALASSELQTMLKERLNLDAGAVVQVLETHVVARPEVTP